MINQYVYLQKQASQLLALQRDYNEYLNKLDALIRDTAKPNNIEESSTIEANEKKKPFLLVNRNPEHLNSSLLDYLKENNLAKELRLLRKFKRVFPVKRVKRRTYSTRRVISQVMAGAITQEISFCWPLNLDSFHISSYFGPRRKENGALGYHWGLDLAALTGTPVKAVASGEVIEASYLPGYGKTIVIKHTQKYKTRYAHLSAILVKIGDKVEQGQKIGRVGSTGNVRSSGRDPSHLHLEVVVLGRRINPLWILPRIS